MKILIAATFKRTAKKLHRNQITALEKAIQEIQENPELGELKVGDLAGIRVYKFRMLDQLILLAYSYIDDETLTLIDFTSHENFYSNIKKQLKH
ncbi:MAG: type II toxin-antitoxin system RelE/ParE family toxin [Gammaproteobacteria bacterium]|nr:type II toxin-antitoxin system RelE/ParE family toxin [Gammaproteobacteria bacterium]